MNRSRVKDQDSSNKNCPTKLSQSWKCVPKQPFSRKCMVENLRFHARCQKYSLVSIEGLEVMTVNIEERNMWAEKRCVCVNGDTKCFGIVVRVFGGC